MDGNFVKYLRRDTVVNEYAMTKEFSPQLYPAKWNIAAPSQDIEVCVEVPISLLADEITNYSKRVKVYSEIA